MYPRILLPLLLAAAPLAVFGESAGPTLRSTGAPTDGPQTCAACHTGPQSGRGSVSLEVVTYKPGVTQTLRITVNDPDATVWGFQITARPVNDETKPAGVFGATSIVQVRCDDGTPHGSAPNCPPVPQFAEQLAAQQTARGAGFTFEVPWTPPANEIGDIVFYIAALAADGDKSPAGDHTYTLARAVQSTGACNFTDRPVLGTAKNAASLQLPFSASALVAVFGTGFQLSGHTRSVGRGDLVNGAFPIALACVGVSINRKRVPITYVQFDQINVQAPEDLPASGPVEIQIILNPDLPNQLLSDVGMLTAIQPLAPAFLTFSGTGSGNIAAQFANTATIVADPALIPAPGAHPAAPGDVITMYGTGFGPTEVPLVAGALDVGINRTTNPVTVTIGNAQAEFFYAGLSPGSISGLYQINVRVPPNAPDGNLPVVATVKSVTTQVNATIPVRHP